MNRDDAEKLLGGYATGTLTVTERKALFDAALTDQTLFNALASEQALKDLLADRRTRQRLLRVLKERPGLSARLTAWLTRPASLALAGGLATAALAVTTVTRLLDVVPPPEPASETAPVRAETRHFRAESPSVAADRLAALEKNAAQDRARAASAQRARAEAGAQPNAAPEAPAPPAKTEPAAGLERARAPAAAPPATEQFMARADAEKKNASDSARTLFFEQTDVSKETRASEATSRDEPAQTPAAGRSLAASGALAKPALQRLGLRYGLVNREEGPAVVVEANQRGYLYAVTRDEAGAATLVYPFLAADPQAALVESGRRYFIPQLGALPASRLTVMLSRNPLDDPAAATTRLKTTQFRQDTAEPPVEGVRGPTSYVVEAAPSSVLLVDISIPGR